MSNVIRFTRPATDQRADGVMAAVNIAARRMGLRNDLATALALSAKRAYQDGRGSAAGVISQFTGAMRAGNSGGAA